MRICSDALAGRVEEACLNGWPCLEAVLFDGWLLRFGGGHTKRSNSVNPIGPSRRTEPTDLRDRIRACETLYAARDLPTIFRLSDTIPHADLAAALDAAGFGAPHDESLVLLADALPPAAEPGPPARLTEGRPGRAWLDAFARISDLDDSAADLHGRILAALAVPAVFAAVEAPGGGIGAVAFGAVHDRLVCVNSVATAAEHRGRGLAGRAVSAVLAWARSHEDAEAACLPVAAGNASARALYRRLGFTREVSRYHYRIAPRR